MAVNKSFGRLWPHCDAKRHLVTVRAPVSDARFPVHAGIAPLVAEGLRRMEYGIGGPAYLCKRPQCGAFNCRPIGGTRSPSNHSGGLALDINWSDNPFRKGASYAMPAWVWGMWESVLGFYWGGRYSDFMHIEYLKDPTAAAAAVRRLGSGGAAPRGKPVLRPGASGPFVEEVQRALALVVDGHYGPETVAVVRRFQQDCGLTVDGVFGAASWTALEDDMPITDADAGKIASWVWKWLLKGEKPYPEDVRAWRLMTRMQSIEAKLDRLIEQQAKSSRDS